MSKKSKDKGPLADREDKQRPVAEPITLATVLAALERLGTLSATRLRDLRSAVKRVSILLGNDPGGVDLDLSAISARLATISPIAAGMTAKRFANIRSDFLAAVKASGLMPVRVETKKTLSPAWVALFARLSGRRAHIGLSRLARHASGEGIEPRDINDAAIDGFIAAVREGSLHQNPRALHRQVTLIWNEAARDPKLGLQQVTVASFRGPPKRIEWSLLPASFGQDVDDYVCWTGRSDPFAADARPRALAPRTRRLRRDQIHAAVSALVETGISPATIRSLADLVTLLNIKAILRRRLEVAGGRENAFNDNLGTMLILIARDWVKVDDPILAELKRLVGKLPVPIVGLTDKNKRFLRQFDDPKALLRLVELPERLWAEVKRDNRPSFRTLAKAQAALAIAVLTYMPVRPQNLSNLTFDTHLFVRAGASAISTLELSSGEVKNKSEIAFDIPPHIAKMLIEYRERIAPKIIGHRPTRLFVNADGTPKSGTTVAWLISTYSKRRAGIVLTPHQFRHLSAKILLDAQPGGFESVRQLLGHKRSETTVNAYAGIDSRRAGRHHQRLIEKAIAPQDTPRQSRHHRRRVSE
jgi:integrase